MKRILLIFIFALFVLPVHCEEVAVQEIVPEQYKQDTNYLLQFIGSFKPLFKKESKPVEVEAEVQSPDEINVNVTVTEADTVEDIIYEEMDNANSSNVSVPMPTISDNKRIKQDKIEPVMYYGVYNKLNYCSMKTESYIILKKNLPFKKKRLLKKYLKEVNKSLSSVGYVGTKQGLMQVKFIVNQDGTTSNVKAYASNYNKDFNQQIITQIKAKSFPVIPINIGGVELKYQFDNIYK